MKEARHKRLPLYKGQKQINLFHSDPVQESGWFGEEGRGLEHKEDFQDTDNILFLNLSNDYKTVFPLWNASSRMYIYDLFLFVMYALF